MSVLIKGMEMPKDCEWCPLCENIGDLGCSVKHLVILRRHGQDKPSWCPLIEIPPHGRLIDASQIPYIDLNSDMPQSKVRVWVAFKDRIERVPTIIEAEEGAEA